MNTVRSNLQFKSNLPSEDVFNLNEFTKKWEQSLLYFHNKPKVRVESLRPILGFDVLEYLTKLPKSESDEGMLAHYDKPTKVVVKRMNREDRLKRNRSLVMKKIYKKK